MILSTRNSFLFLLLTFVVFSANCQRRQKALIVSIDFESKIATESMSGFTHFKNFDGVKQYAETLQPKFWRVGAYLDTSSSDIDKIVEMGIRPILVVSDKYGYPTVKNKKWKSPLESKDYRALIESLYNRYGNKVIYDLWNEPNHKSFGKFDVKTANKIFKQGHDVIRALPGGDKAVITGPSIHYFNKNILESFLSFCQDNDVRVDILSWHEWRTGSELNDLASDVKYLKDILSVKYSRVGVKDIVLNEVISKEIQFSPSGILNTLFKMEKAGIDGTCKACWMESNGVLNCRGNTIDGLLDQKGRKRSSFWAYDFYATINQADRFAAEVASDNIPFFAGVFKKGDVVFLLANDSDVDYSRVQLNISSLGKRMPPSRLKNFKLQVFEVQNSGEKPLDVPKVVLSEIVDLTNLGQLTLPFKLSRGNAYYVELSKI